MFLLRFIARAVKYGCKGLQYWCIWCSANAEMQRNFCWAPGKSFNGSVLSCLSSLIISMFYCSVLEVTNAAYHDRSWCLSGLRCGRSFSVVFNCSLLPFFIFVHIHYREHSTCRVLLNEQDLRVSIVNDSLIFLPSGPSLVSVSFWLLSLQRIFWQYNQGSLISYFSNFFPTFTLYSFAINASTNICLFWIFDILTIKQISYHVIVLCFLFALKVWDTRSNYKCIKTFADHTGMILALCTHRYVEVASILDFSSSTF